MTDRSAEFFDYMHKRHDIYLARQANRPKPWTEDRILRDYRFCNVYRELDTVTIWIRKHIREPYWDHPNLWFMLAIARRINLPSTLEYLMGQKFSKPWPFKTYNPEAMRVALDVLTETGAQVYTGAYMITAETGPEHTGQTKSRTTAYSNLGKLWDARKEVEPQLHGSLEQAYNAILGKGFAWGPFMTYEVVTDLRHTRYLSGAFDIDSWANAGPGAIRGLNRLTGLPLTAKSTPGMDRAAMEQLLVMSRLKRYWPNNSKYPKLEMRDIEHSLCEFDKYERVRLGQGTPRSKYPGAA